MEVEWKEKEKNNRQGKANNLHILTEKSKENAVKAVAAVAATAGSVHLVHCLHTWPLDWFFLRIHYTSANVK